MHSRQRWVWLLLGLVAATGALLSLAPPPAGAQILDPPGRQEQPPRRPPQRPPAASDSAITAEDERAFSDGRLGLDSPPPPQQLPAQDGILEQESSSQDAEAQDAGTQDAGTQGTGLEGAGGDTDEFGEARARPRQVPPQDGDLMTVIEPPAPTDGLLDLSAPGALASEEDVTLADMRSAQDIAILSGTTPGFDPLLLEAQELNPVFSDRAISQFVPDPFVPLGTRLGSFILFTSVETDGDYNSNIFASPEALGDVALEVRPAARLASNWSTHAAELRASGDLSFHDKFPTEDDRAYLVEALSRIDITRRSNVQAAVSHELAQESRSAINASSVGTRPDVVVNRARLAGNQQFNRLSVQLRGNVIDTRYGNDIFEGEVVSNADRDFLLYEEAVRPQWEFTPELFLYSDIAFNQRNYATAAFTDGINRTSAGERYRLGVSFGNTGEFLRGSVSLGYGQQTYDSPLLEPVDGLLLDADLTWRVTAVTSLLFTAATDVAETTTVDSGGVLERTYALEARHNFSTRLIGSLGTSYLNRDFVGGDLTEQQATGAAGLEYYLSREAVLFGRYLHTAFYTTAPQGNYTVEEVQLGVRLRH